MEHYYYDDYDGFVEDEEEIDDFPEATQTIWTQEHMYESLGACIKPSLMQISNYVLVLVGMSAVCRISWYLLRRLTPTSNIEFLQHAVSILCGLIVLYTTLQQQVLILLCFAIFSYLLLFILQHSTQLRKRSIGSTLAIILISAHFFYESLCAAPEAWHRLRGIQMVAMMKTISLAYDLESLTHSTKLKAMPGLFSYLGYIFLPANCVLGPWICYNDYVCSFRATELHYKQLGSCCLNIAFALGFLSVSNCVAPLIAEHPFISNWQWLRIYFEALSVRCSHYFICYLSQATLAAAAQSLPDQHACLGSLVVRPMQIEWPRSLPAVVRAWNIPMHRWLKTYVFQPWQSTGHYLVAIFGTYMVSALLHGLHLRIYLVLLSLAVFGFVENVLRAKLSSTFNACIAANPCKGAMCRFTHCPQRYGWHNAETYCILLINTAFSLLAIFHLAYLGIMMDSSNATGNLTDDAQIIWQKWHNLNFFNHLLVLATYIFYRLI